MSFGEAVDYYEYFAAITSEEIYYYFQKELDRNDSRAAHHLSEANLTNEQNKTKVETCYITLLRLEVLNWKNNFQSRE